MSTPADGAAGPLVAYLGPEGTYSEEALLAGAGEQSLTALARPTIYDVISAVRDGEATLAVAPIENSLDGSVTVTLDLLAELAGELEIVGETLVHVRHALIAAGPVELDQIRTVITHPQVPGQCERLLRGELAGAAVLPASSTAEAVRIVVEQGRAEEAAIGPLLAARIYGGQVLRAEVQDRADNETRFVWLARRERQATRPQLAGADPGGSWRTSIVFWGAGAERPGWLVRCLDEFARREINMTRIESRPQRRGFGSYVFFVDLAGADEGTGAIAEALDGMRGLCEQVRVLGSYRAAARGASGD